MPDEHDKRENEIEEVRREDQARAGPAKKSATERKRHLKIIGTKLEKAIVANDERAYAELLRLANVHEGSPEWKRAWEYFRSRHGRS